MSLKEKALKIHRALFRNISRDTTNEDLNDIKQELRREDFGGFGAGEIQRDIKTTEDFLQKLEKKGRIKIGNYEKLRELAEVLDLQPILDFVAQAEDSLVAIDWPVKLPQPGSVDDNASIPSTVAKRQKTGETTETPRDDTPSTRLNFRSGQYKDSVPDNIPFDCHTKYESGPGYVLFINNFFPKKEDQQRKGAEFDEENINNLFKNVLKDYHLEYKKDVSLKKLKDYLKDVKDTLLTGDYKSFIFMLGTHGAPKTDGPDRRMKDGVQMADGKWISVEDIVRNFHGDQIPTMQDKPKVFILQSCRGDEMQTFVHSSDNAETVPNQKTKNYPQPDFQPAYRPVNSDILIAYASSEGTKAWRHEDKGSWFVTDLCEVIAEYYDKETMVNILIRVNGRMVCREEETDKQERIKQMPCFLCTFTRQFMLAYPKY